MLEVFMVFSYKRICSICLLGLCLPFFMQAGNGFSLVKFCNPHSLIAKAKNVVGYVVKPIACVVNWPISFVKAHPEKVGVFAAVGAVAGACIAFFKRFNAMQSERTRLQNLVEERNAQVGQLQNALAVQKRSVAGQFVGARGQFYIALGGLQADFHALRDGVARELRDGREFIVQQGAVLGRFLSAKEAEHRATRAQVVISQERYASLQHEHVQLQQECRSLRDRVGQFSVAGNGQNGGGINPARNVPLHDS